MRTTLSADAFGFTELEVEKLAAAAGCPETVGALKEWYDGYSFGDARIYNPWSVISFLASQDKLPRPYWISTSGDDVIWPLLVLAIMVAGIGVWIYRRP